MKPHQAYQSQRDATPLRVDLIITAFRKVLDWLAQAETDLTNGNRANAIRLSLRAQSVIASLAGGVVGANEEPEASFLRVYEFASHCLARGEAKDIGAARRVLRILLEGFEAARDQAAALESHGKIAPLGSAHEVQLTV